MQSKPLLNDSIYSEDLPLFLSSGVNQVWLRCLSNSKQGQLLCQLMLLTLSAYQKGEYHLFDAHTTSNCCHGMALHVRNTILSIRKIHLAEVKDQLKAELIVLQNFEKRDFSQWILQFPEALFELASLYALRFCIEVSNDAGRKTKPKKLKKIEASVGIDFCNNIIRSLQKHYSNFIARSYAQYLFSIENKIKINNLPVELWGRYVQPDYLRQDQSETLYASCLYSMQVSLAYLIHTKATVAVINDVRRDDGHPERFVSILQGDGKEKFCVLPHEPKNLAEVVIVFGGCSTPPPDQGVGDIMAPWLTQFPSLVLACDMHYPQFPKLSREPSFDSERIVPKEEQIEKVIERHRIIQGVSAENPHLFCLTHIHPASLKSVLRVKEGEEEALAGFFVPSNHTKPLDSSED